MGSKIWKPEIEHLRVVLALSFRATPKRVYVDFQILKAKVITFDVMAKPGSQKKKTKRSQGRFALDKRIEYNNSFCGFSCFFVIIIFWGSICQICQNRNELVANIAYTESMLQSMFLSWST